MGQLFWEFFGILAVDKSRKEWQITISIAFLLLDCLDINLNFKTLKHWKILCLHAKMGMGHKRPNW